MSIIRRLLPKLHWSQIRSCTSSSKKESPLKNLLDDAASFDSIKAKTEWSTEPYTSLPKFLKEETADPRDSSIIIFPGQGTQFLDMGKGLFKYPNVNDIYECASEVVGFDLKNIKTKEELDKYCQVSIVVASLAAVESLRDKKPSALPSCVMTAGFSLGEITALIFGGAFSLEDGIKIVNIRSLAMEAASKENPGGMLTIMFNHSADIKKAIDDAKDHCIENGVAPICTIANYLYPDCKVVSGSKEALRFIEVNAKKYGIKRTKRVNVQGAFHSEAMKNAVEPMRKALQLCNIETPEISVYSAVTTERYRNKNDIIKILPSQIVKPVKWEQLLHKLYSRPKGKGFPKTYEIGPGNSLRTILRQVNGAAWDSSFSIFE